MREIIRLQINALFFYRFLQRLCGCRFQALPKHDL
jgi:hypothetical protein